MKLDTLKKSQTIVVIAVLTAALAAWPMRAGLLHGNMVGSGPDVATTLWTMWWFQAEWTGAAWGGESYLFNFPWGGSGAILSPITSVTWALSEPLIGPARAGALTTWSQVWLFGLSLYWLAREIGLSRSASAIVILATFTQRYLFFGVGETSVVGITALPIVVGLVALIRLRTNDRLILWVLIAAGCMALQPLENPYLTPVLPGVSLLMLSRTKGRKATLISLIVGVVAMVVVGGIHQGATTLAYESTRPDSFVGFGGFQWAAVERPWARAPIQWMLFPPETIWSTGTDQSIWAQGREYLGLSVLILAILGAYKHRLKALPWLGFGLIGVVFATGSDWFGLPGAFALLNAICIRLVRALTQPTRYLVLANIGLALSAGWGFQWILDHRRKWANKVSLILVADAFLLGGLSLKLPEMRVATPSCLDVLDGESGGVLVWPWDGADQIHPDATVESRLMQIAHGKPGATIGTGSWPLTGRVFPGHLLRRAGWTEGFQGGTGHMDLVSVANWGYRWVVADLTAPSEILGDPDSFFGEPTASCHGASIHKMPDPDGTNSPYSRQNFSFAPVGEDAPESEASGGGTHGY